MNYNHCTTHNATWHTHKETCENPTPCNITQNTNPQNNTHTAYLQGIKHGINWATQNTTPQPQHNHQKTPMTDTQIFERYIQKFGGTMNLHLWRQWSTGWPQSKPEPVPEACGDCAKERNKHPIMTIDTIQIEQWGAK